VTLSLSVWRQAWAVLLVALLALLALPLHAADAAASMAPIEAFVREGCPHCAQAEAFLAQLQSERPGLKVIVRDVMKEPAAMDRLQQLVREHGAGTARVPAVLVGGQLLVGYSVEAHSDQLIRSALAGARPAAAAASAAGTCEADTGLSCKRTPDTQPAPPESFTLEVLGHTIALDDVGLPLFSLVMGLLDGFNPCSMWVLLLMISILAPLNDRKRMLAIAGTFVLVEGIAYFLFMTAWLNLFLLIGLSRTSQLIIAAIAIGAGLINVKDFFAFGRGISLSIPERAKPGIYQRIRGLLHAPTIWAAVIGAAVLAVLVQMVEFLCTSGFPMLFTRILTLRQLEPASYYGYMLLYNLAYMLDDVVVLGTGVILLSRHRLQEKEGRWLKVISGVVMIGLGIYLVLDK
jgi:glutaredoxin